MSKIDKNLFVSFLNLLKVKHTRRFSAKYFNEHPHKYNLYGISSMLSDYGVRNIGTRIENKEEDIRNIQTPFIAHTGVDFVCVHKVTQESVHYLWRGRNIIFSLIGFLQIWNGVVLLAEATKESIEPDYTNNRRTDFLIVIRKLMLIAIIASVLLVGYVKSNLFFNSGRLILLVVNLIGVYISYLLLLKQLNFQSDYADKICSLFSQKDCNNVLESKAAKLWNVIGWSEIGLGYFVSNILLLIFFPYLIPYYSIINIGALCYSLWSIWYQKVIAKQWCALCVIVQILFWLSFSVAIVFGFIHIPPVNIVDYFYLIALYGIPVISINIIVSFLVDANKSEGLTQEIKSIKAQKEVFLSLLYKQPYFNVDLSNTTIVFGNRNSKLRITVFSNPYCNPCALVHAQIEKMMNETDDICVQYIFSSFNPSLDYANKFLISICFQREENEARRLFLEWFEFGKLDRECFFQNMNLIIDENVEREFCNHENWKAANGMKATPTVLINGYKLPDYYKIEDIIYFADENININGHC